MKLIYTTFVVLTLTTFAMAQEISPEDFKARGHLQTELEMKCKTVNNGFTRCENSEVIIYKHYQGSMEVKFK